MQPASVPVIAGSADRSGTAAATSSTSSSRLGPGGVGGRQPDRVDLPGPLLHRVQAAPAAPACPGTGRPPASSTGRPRWPRRSGPTAAGRPGRCPRRPSGASVRCRCARGRRTTARMCSAHHPSKASAQPARSAASASSSRTSSRACISDSATPRPAAGLVVHTASPTKTRPGSAIRPGLVGLALVAVVQPAAGQHRGDRSRPLRVGPGGQRRDGRGGGVEGLDVTQPGQLAVGAGPRDQRREDAVVVREDDRQVARDRS